MIQSFDIKSIIINNKWIIIITVFIITIGCCCGIFLERGLLSDDKTTAFATIENMFFNTKNDISFWDTFITYVRNDFWLFLIAIALTSTIILFPLLLVLLFFEGFTLGFTSTLIFDYFGVKGESIIFSTLISYGLISILIYSCISITSMHYVCSSLKTYRENGIKGRSKLQYKDNLTVYLKYIFTCFIISVVLLAIQASLLSAFA